MANGKTGVQLSTRRIMGNHQLIIITRLLEVIETIETIDELFVWLANMVMERMDVQVVQFWARQDYKSGRAACELRTIVCRNQLLPHHVVINQPLADRIGDLLETQQSVTPSSVRNIFSPYLSKLLIRYDLNYWGCQFMSNPILLPSARDDFAYEKVATPLTLAISVFSEHTPSSRLLPTLGHILEHVLAIVKNHGLLTIAPRNKQELQVNKNRDTEKRPALTEFVPYRIQSFDITKRTTKDDKSLIPDTNAYRLYLAIDGRKNIGQLAYTTQLNAQEFYAALCLLLAQKRIQFFERGGISGENMRSLPGSLAY